ncbi:hypothetical protein E2C01_017885 [Portunus trituberculatus]|uniref:Uncharacterized protein n=1 Tax=Portunus trituberculatus TaxID=210409 RepID=A0A5B7DT40_PORTR|nr:hypothetical protein [Portunus trituberculatus]
MISCYCPTVSLKATLGVDHSPSYSAAQTCTCLSSSTAASQQTAVCCCCHAWAGDPPPPHIFPPILPTIPTPGALAQASFVCFGVFKTLCYTLNHTGPLTGTCYCTCVLHCTLHLALCVFFLHLYLAPCDFLLHFVPCTLYLHAPHPAPAPHYLNEETQRGAARRKPLGERAPHSAASRRCGERCSFFSTHTNQNLVMRLPLERYNTLHGSSSAPPDTGGATSLAAAPRLASRLLWWCVNCDSPEPSCRLSPCHTALPTLTHLPQPR